MNETIAELERLYAALPTTNCKGLCWNSCGPIDMSDAERGRIADLGMVIPAFTQAASDSWVNDEKVFCCPALDRDLRCSVYEVRPMICRLWGLAGPGTNMDCPHGCEPSRVLDIHEVFEFLLRSYEVGGHELQITGDQRTEFHNMLDDPTVGPLFMRFLNGDRAISAQLAAAIDARRKASR